MQAMFIVSTKVQQAINGHQKTRQWVQQVKGNSFRLIHRVHQQT